MEYGHITALDVVLGNEIKHIREKLWADNIEAVYQK